MNEIQAETALRRIIEDGCIGVAIHYEKDDGAPPTWRMLHWPSLKKFKAGSVLRGREDDGDTIKTWKLDRIRDIYLPDSPRLTMDAWILNEPIKFNQPIATPSGGRVKTIYVFADITFRVASQSIQVVGARLSTTANICGHVVNVCSNRSGQAWAADWSLSWTIGSHIQAMAIEELRENEQLRKSMWKRYMGWWRTSGLKPFGALGVLSGALSSVFGRLGR